MSSNISSQGIKAIHSVATTSMPFLYQTRTLSSNMKQMRQPAIRFLPSRPYQSHLFHNSAYSCMSITARTLLSSKGDANDPSSSNLEELPSQESKLVIGRRAYDRNEDKPVVRRFVFDRKANKTERREDLPWDSPSISRSTSAHNGPGSDFFSEADNIQFDNTYDHYGDDMFSEDEAEPNFSIPPARKPGESTITLEERNTFESIFADIYSRSQKSSRPQSESLDDLSKVSKENARETLNSIMEEAVRDPQNTLFTSQSREKAMDKLKQYPRVLRYVASRALGLRGEPPQVDPRPPQEEAVDKYNEVRQKEQERVEAEMQAAPTDIALWAVMEKEVFSLIPRLGLEEKAAQPVSLKKKSKKSFQHNPIGESQEMAPGPAPLDMDLYVPLYAAYLLYGLRLLQNSFAKPSPLACNVLPRVKSLGLVSHVLGGTTALYNELLRIYWYQYDDFRGVLRLLEEMEASGLELDRETLDVLINIRMMQGRNVFSQGSKVERTPLYRLWKMGDFAPGRFLSWEDRIKHTLEIEE